MSRTTTPTTRQPVLVAGQWEDGAADETLHSVDATSGERLASYACAGPDQIDRAARAAADAFETLRATSPQQRAELLEDIAARLAGDEEAIVTVAHTETGLPIARLQGELARTTGQLRLFSSLLDEASYLDVRIDHATDTTPDLRFHRIPVGPVAVFGASNFPLAFSNAGGDTASALAAGCPVIVKAHQAHLGTGARVSGHIADAVAAAGLPGGTHSALVGRGRVLGTALVQHPAIAAVGFTGSRSGGLALVAAAQSRPDPIPVFAEMSSLNPAILFPSALTDATAAAYLDSLTLGAGQFCTKPGLLLVPEGPDGDRFVAEVARLLESRVGQTMLTAGIGDALAEASSAVGGLDGVTEVGRGTPGGAATAAAPQVFSTSAARIAADERTHTEMFGAAGLIARYAGEEDLLAAVRALPGQLTATVHAETEESPVLVPLLRLLERKAGRIIVGGWPTGVAVAHTMVHGGPFPATTDARVTSVGTAAIDRFLRPVTYQSTPEALLPPAVQEENPWGTPRAIDVFSR
ncbi:aldehyde dehydrogenase (NADP(+)) [Ruania alkalisoli]|uniref:Aldehyde dehydrogenase (NADP(+)) n=1 Tax=Ruania alkalisoli TaxID=2779775 RepID=A0A7M1SX83_9MICO|nr:aldehyde dehydrogenase (NADP(+)) [Ruania alkalisoli]QOR71637.1 aldehyde dehydrogenase (NADP(+)) [Ruania alkalisoli]